MIQKEKELLLRKSFDKARCSGKEVCGLNERSKSISHRVRLEGCINAYPGRMSCSWGPTDVGRQTHPYKALELRGRSQPLEDYDEHVLHPHFSIQVLARTKRVDGQGASLGRVP